MKFIFAQFLLFSMICPGHRYERYSELVVRDLHIINWTELSIKIKNKQSNKIINPSGTIIFKKDDDSGRLEFTSESNSDFQVYNFPKEMLPEKESDTKIYGDSWYTYAVYVAKQSTKEKLVIKIDKICVNCLDESILYTIPIETNKEAKIKDFYIENGQIIIVASTGPSIVLLNIGSKQKEKQ